VNAVRFNPWTARKQFWVYADGGLCNRLRVLLSGIGFSELTGRELVVCWPVHGPETDRSFQAALSDLWMHSYREVDMPQFFSMPAHPGAVEASLPPDPQSSARALYTQSCYSYFEILPLRPRDYLTRLRLAPLLEDRVKEFTERYLLASSRFGVHIRTNRAHEQTIRHSPVSWFERRMAELHEQYPEALFYLSCDSDEVSAALHHRFPGQIRELCTPPGYNTREGIQKGVMDLYLLAQTDYILGSYYSSFSDMAFWMQGEKGYEDSQKRLGSFPTKSPQAANLGEGDSALGRGLGSSA
jgi:hypothetical protein